MTSTFKEACRLLNIRFINLQIEKIPDGPDAIAPPLVIMHGHAFRGMPWLLDDPERRILHLIRDPRDVIISGMHYHCTAKEHWLHVPQKKFGGLTYQVKLNGLPDDRSRYFFEMRHSRAIVSMLRWNYQRPNAFECKYEDLISDTDMCLFTRILAHLGFSEQELPVCRSAFWRQFIFGGMPEAKRNKKTAHIRSGAPQQWPSAFDRGMGEKFVRQFGDVLVRLGYEKDDSWLDKLPERQPEALQTPAPPSMDRNAEITAEGST